MTLTIKFLLLKKMSARNYNKPVVEIERKSKIQYDGFPDLHTCWEQSTTHKKYFLDYLDCVSLQQYHQQQQGCKKFDDLIARWADGDKLKFFSFYNIIGRKPNVSSYIDGLVRKKSLLRQLAINLHLVKKTPNEIDPLPKRYEDWPVHFELQAVYPIFAREDRDIILQSIESCIKRRQMFRNLCIKACCKKIDTKNHDTFLLILQILRARIVLYQM